LARTELEEVAPSLVPPATSSLRQPAQQARARDTVLRILQSARTNELIGAGAMTDRTAQREAA